MATAPNGLANAVTEARKMQDMQMVKMNQQLAEIREILALLPGQLRQMERNIDRNIEQTLRRELSRYEKNNIARIHNSRLSDETHHLEPFYNMQGEEIQGFPETSRDISRMNAAGVNALLRQLGLAENGGLENKKTRLRRHIGLMVL
ncbi:hypothetical protein DFH27DRAFT_577721 [Peziza echinospora]|nr:hypothetical protein DFH27DRAFT_577721 [Peziza echinospora]